MYIKLLALLCCVTLQAQTVNVGIWEVFDKYTLPEGKVYKSGTEIYNGKDDDANGFIDDLHGIAFDAFESLKTEKFYTSFKDRANYDHGTSVAYTLLEHNPNVMVYGVGFVPTSKRLKDSGILALSVEERLANLEKEYAQMRYFIVQSLAYFKVQNCKLVNLSWGLSLDYFAEINQNLGHTKQQRLQQSKKWLKTFRRLLKKEFKKYPDIYFVVAVGNDGVSIKKALDVPGTIRLKNVFVVGALDKEKQDIAAFSNYGEQVLYAPGTAIKTKKALKMHTVEDGTSIAAPVVTAYIAKLLEQSISKRELRTQVIQKFKIPLLKKR